MTCTLGKNGLFGLWSTSKDLKTFVDCKHLQLVTEVADTYAIKNLQASVQQLSNDTDSLSKKVDQKKDIVPPLPPEESGCWVFYGSGCPAPSVSGAAKNGYAKNHWTKYGWTRDTYGEKVNSCGFQRLAEQKKWCGTDDIMLHDNRTADTDTAFPETDPVVPDPVPGCPDGLVLHHPSDGSASFCRAPDAPACGKVGSACNGDNDCYPLCPGHTQSIECNRVRKKCVPD